MTTHGMNPAASTACSSNMPTGKAERLGAPPAIVETSDQCEVPTRWLTEMKAESSELREMLREAVAETAERAHTASGRRMAAAFLDTMYQHNAENLRFIDRASELDDRDAMIVLSDLQEIIYEVILQLVEVVPPPPTSTRARHERAHQPVVGQ